MGDAEKSQKPEGMAATAKIHGTVDKSGKSEKGHHNPGENKNEGDVKGREDSSNDKESGTKEDNKE
jgi:hypothetical protein